LWHILQIWNPTIKSFSNSRPTSETVSAVQDPMTLFEQP
jgi:hypothetical protein